MNHDESRAMSRLKYTLSKCEQDHTSNAVTRLKIYGEFWVQPRITVLEEVYALFFFGYKPEIPVPPTWLGEITLIQ